MQQVGAMVKSEDMTIYPTLTVYLWPQALGTDVALGALGKTVCMQGLCTEQMLCGCHFLAFPVCKST